jgi:hypothetical protein
MKNTVYKLILWLYQYTTIPCIAMMRYGIHPAMSHQVPCKSKGQRLFSLLVFPGCSSGSNSGLGRVSSLLWCLLILSWMTSLKGCCILYVECDLLHTGGHWLWLWEFWIGISAWWLLHLPLGSLHDDCCTCHWDLCVMTVALATGISAWWLLHLSLGSLRDDCCTCHWDLCMMTVALATGISAWWLLHLSLGSLHDDCCTCHWDLCMMTVALATGISAWWLLRLPLGSLHDDCCTCCRNPTVPFRSSISVWLPLCRWAICFL